MENILEKRKIKIEKIEDENIQFLSRVATAYNFRSQKLQSFLIVNLALYLSMLLC